jgi:hypothetical protein
MNRDNIMSRLRPSVKNLLSKVEENTGLQVRFESLPSGSYVAAEYRFDPIRNTATVFLGDRWEDVDVAHELTHMELELVEGYHVLAWRRNVVSTSRVEIAFGRVRTYVDDEVVHARLVGDGYELEGEVLRPQLFDDVYTNVPRYLEEFRPRPEDGMAHLDSVGYGDLCRSSFLVQAELILESYGQDLSDDRLERVKHFIETFRAHRGQETAKADEILGLFKRYDVQSVEGHKQILLQWAGMEHLDQFVGISAYRCQAGRFILPWP